MRYYYAPSRKLYGARKSHAFNNSVVGRGSKLLATMTFGSAFDNTAMVESNLQECEQQYLRELSEYMAQIAPMFQGLSENEIDQKLFAMHDEKYAQAKPIRRKYLLKAIVVAAIESILLFTPKSVMYPIIVEMSGKNETIKGIIMVALFCIMVALIVAIVLLVKKANNAYNEADYLRGIIEQRKAAAQEAIEAVHEQKVVSATNLFMGNKR